MLKAYTVTLETDVVEEIRKDNPINFSKLVRSLLKKHLEETKNE